MTINLEELDAYSTYVVKKYCGNKQNLYDIPHEAVERSRKNIIRKYKDHSSTKFIKQHEPSKHLPVQSQ